MTKRLLSFVLAALMVFSMMPAIFATSKSNKDTHQVEGAEPTIEMKNTNFVSYLGIIKGYPNGSLGLDDPVTRWMMALLAIRVMTGDVDDTSWLPDITYTTRFEDVTDGDVASLYLGAIALCAEKGFIRGIEDGGKLYFKPYDTITYVDALVIAVRLLGYESDEMNAGYPTTYTEKAYALGLSDGIEGVALKDEITRETAFQLIYNVLFAKRANSDKTFQEENFPYHTVKFVCTNTGAVLKTYTVVHGSTLYQSTGLTPAGFDSLVPGRPAPSAVYYGGDDGVYWSLDPYGEQKLSRPESEYDRSHFARTATITEDTTLYIYYPEKDTKVEFVDADGNVIKTINGKGAFTVYTSDYPDLPANTAKYTYTGWSKDGMFTVDNTTVRVTAVSSVNQYDVTFLDKDGNQIDDKQKVAYGTCPAYPTAPEVEGMSFAGWTVVPGTVITENTTIQATYSEDPVVVFNFVDKDGASIADSVSVYLKKDVALTIPNANISGDYKLNKIEIVGIEDAETLADVDAGCTVNVIYKTKTTDIGHFQGGVFVNKSGDKFTLAEGVDLSGHMSDVYTNLIRYGVTLWDGVIDSADDVVEFANGKFYSEAAAEYDDSYVAIDKDTLDENLSYYHVGTPSSALYSLYLIDEDGDGDYDLAITIDYHVASYINGYLITYYGVQANNGALATVQGMTYKTDVEYENGSWMYVGYDYAKFAFTDDVLYSEEAKDMAHGNITAASALTMTFTFDNGETYNLTNDYAAGYTFEGITAEEVIAFLQYNFTREPGDPDHEYYYYSFDGMLVYLAEYGAAPFIIEEDLSEDEMDDIFVVTDVLYNEEYDLGMTVKDFVFTAYKNGNEKVQINGIDYYEFYYNADVDNYLTVGDFFMLAGKIVVVDPLTGKGFEFYITEEIVHAYDDNTGRSWVEDDSYEDGGYYIPVYGDHPYCFDYPYSDGTDCAEEYIEFKYYFDLEATKNSEDGEDVYNFGYTAWEYKEGQINDQTDYHGGILSDDATFVISFGTQCAFGQANANCDCAGCQLAKAEGFYAQKVVVLTGKDLRTAWESVVADEEEDVDATSFLTWIAGHVWYYDAEAQVWMIKADSLCLGDIDLGLNEYEAPEGDYVFMLPSFAKDGAIAWEDAEDGEHTIYTFKTTGLFDFYTGADYAGAEYVKTYIDFTKEEVLEDACHNGYVMIVDEDGYAWFTEVQDSEGVQYTLAFELLECDEHMNYDGWKYSLEYIFNESTANRNIVCWEDDEIGTFNMYNRLAMLTNTINVNELPYISTYIPSNVNVSVNMPYEGVDYTKLSDFFTDGGDSLTEAVATIALALSENYEFFYENDIEDFNDLIDFIKNYDFENFVFENRDELVAFLMDTLKDVVKNQTLVNVTTGKNGDDTYVEITTSIGVTNLMKLMFNYDLTGENAVTNDFWALIDVVGDVVDAIFNKQIANWAVYDYVEYKIEKAFAASAAATAESSVLENVQFYNYDKENDTYVEYDLVDGIDYYVQHHDFYNILWVFDAETGTLRGYFRDIDVSVKDYDMIEIVADGYVDLVPWVEYSQEDDKYCYGYDYAYGIYDYVRDEYLADVEYWGENFEMLIAEFKYNENVNISAKVEWLTDVTFDEKGNAVPVYEETDVILAYFVEDEDGNTYVALANNDFYAAPYYGCTFGYPEYRVTVSCHAWTFTTNDTDTVKFTYKYTPSTTKEVDGETVSINVIDPVNTWDNPIPSTAAIFGEGNEKTLAELKAAFEAGEVSAEQMKTLTWGACPTCGHAQPLVFEAAQTNFRTCACDDCDAPLVGGSQDGYKTTEWRYTSKKTVDVPAVWTPVTVWTIDNAGVNVQALVVVITTADGKVPAIAVEIDGVTVDADYTLEQDGDNFYFTIPVEDITGDIVVNVVEAAEANA